MFWDRSWLKDRLTVNNPMLILQAGVWDSRCQLVPEHQTLTNFAGVKPYACSGVVRIDPLRFLAGCRTRRLNQALSLLSLSIVF